MYFDLSVTIDRDPEDVFIFLRDKDLYIQKPGSRGEIFSEITIYDRPNRLEDPFHGSGMKGYLKLLHPLIRAILLNKLKRRLIDIKDELENES